jgi:hypothetical protein
MKKLCYPLQVTTRNEEIELLYTIQNTNFQAVIEQKNSDHHNKFTQLLCHLVLESTK